MESKNLYSMKYVIGRDFNHFLSIPILHYNISALLETLVNTVESFKEWKWTFYRKIVGIDI